MYIESVNSRDKIGEQRKLMSMLLEENCEHDCS